MGVVYTQETEKLHYKKKTIIHQQIAKKECLIESNPVEVYLKGV